MVNGRVGYNTKQRLVGRASLTETNFRGRGQGLNVLWEQGTTDAVGGPASYEVGFNEPWLNSRHTSLSLTAYNKVIYRFSSGIFDSGTLEDDETYNERHKGGDATFSRPLGEFVRGFLEHGSRTVTNPELLQEATAVYAQIARGDVEACLYGR